MEESDSTLMVSGPPAQQPPPSCQEDAQEDYAVTTLVPSSASTSLPLNLPSDMMTKFEVLSRAFRSEVEGLVDQEKAASRETAEQLHARIKDLEDKLDEHGHLAEAGASRIHSFLEQHKNTWLPHVFCGENTSSATKVTLADLIKVLDMFVHMQEVDRDPELEAAGQTNQRLSDKVAEQEAELATLRDDLREARILKTQEERDLAEFRSLREKESELQDANSKMAQLQSQLDEMQSTQKILLARASQSEAALAEKSRKLVTLMKQVEKETEQCRLLSNENNTLRLNLGKDSDYVKVVHPPADPLSYTSRSGALGEDLEQEEQRLKDELCMVTHKFPGLSTGSANCRGWCDTQISRQCAIYRSFLHMLQDFRQDAPTGLDIDFVSKTKEVDEAWLQREEEMKDSDAAFHESEKILTKKWEEQRLELTTERDVKIKQLMEQADRSQTRAEKQLLMQQAKLFGQRMDTQIERLWEDQRKERDERWAQHSQAKQESRQKFKDQSLLMQQEAEGLASAADRFQDMARARLAGPEDAWVRNVAKSSAVSTSALKGHGLLECLKASGMQSPGLPKEGSQFGGLAPVAETIEELLLVRRASRKHACKELSDQSLQHLRQCVERFIQNEGVQQQKKASAAQPDDSSKPPEYSNATIMQALLRSRQHRVISDTMRRQFYDFMLVLRLASLAAVHLLPDCFAANFRSRDAKLDMPAVPQELKREIGVSTQGERSTVEKDLDDQDAGLLDEKVEGQFLYDTLLNRLLERLLTAMHTKQREELLELKREHAKEIRQCLQHLCQLEPQTVDKTIELDLEEYKAQIKTKLMSDCEYHLCEERRQLNEQVDEEVETHMKIYQRQIAEEERSALKDRRKWLTERSVVLQSQGASCPGDRAVIQYLRSELHMCELRFEKRDRELADSELPLQTSSVESQMKKKRPSPPSTPRSFKDDEAPISSSISNSPPPQDCSMASSPAPPATQPPPNRRPSPGRGARPKPSCNMTFPIGRPSGMTSGSTHDLHSTARNMGDFAGVGPPHCSPKLSNESNFPVGRPAGVSTLMQMDSSLHGINRGDFAGAGPSSFSATDPTAGQQLANASRKRPPAAPVQSPPQSHESFMNSPSFGADGGAGFGRQPSPSFGDEVEFAKGLEPSFGYESEGMKTSLPLYDWPFAGCEMMCDMNTKPVHDMHKPKASCNYPSAPMPDILPPLKAPISCSLPMEKAHDVGCYSAGLSLQAVPLAQGLKSPRGIPQQLPPMISPRAR